MTSDTTYNGWTNYETWNVNMWIENDEGMYDEACEMARQATSEYQLSKDLESWFEEIYGDQVPESGPLADLLTHALGMVDWYEIAEHYYADNHEGDEDSAEDSDEDSAEDSAE